MAIKQLNLPTGYSGMQLKLQLLFAAVLGSILGPRKYKTQGCSNPLCKVARLNAFYEQSLCVVYHLYITYNT